MIRIFESIPYVGAGPLRFGMGPEEVIALLGEPQVVTRTWKNELAHGYPGLKLVYSKQNALAECGFSSPLQLIVAGIDVIGDMRAAQKLARLDPNPLQHLDTALLFRKLGVTMGVRRTPDDCEVAMFTEEALGDVLSEFEPYTVPGAARTVTLQATVLELREENEEKVLLRVGDVRLWCHVSVAPYALTVGMPHPVQLALVVEHDYHVVPAEAGAAPSFVRSGESFNYSITGKMDGTWLKVGKLAFEDDTLLRHFGDLDQRMVQMNVDRIDAYFCRPVRKQARQW